ncbi:lipopolysaccharide biosynthesis protein, partial [Staphylococcus simulans]|uniref:lipopolysaccharide biosynthesis protein n=1 Tax=Staphylococcus simulans TaxID=1286 RepID=UPI001A7E1A46
IVSIKSKIKNNQFSKLRKFILRDVLISSVVLGGVVVITSYLFGDKIINIIYGSGYADKSYILTIVAISIIFNFQGWMYDTTLMALERYKIQLFASFITLLASITASLLLIPNYGLLGASLAIVVITFIQSTIKLVVIMSIMIKKGAVK